MSNFMTTEMALELFEGASNNKFHENPSSGSGLKYASGRTDEQT
jgi:hypothetical protein